LDYYGKLYEFENTYFDNPKKIGFINVYQIGELGVESGYEIPNHTQICHEISFIVSGSGVMHCDGKEYPVKTGDINVVPYGKSHRIVVDENCDSIRFAYIGFLFNEEARYDSFKEITDFYENPSPCVASDTGEIRMLINMLINEIYSKPAYHSIVLESFLHQIIVYTYRLLSSIKTTIYVPDSSSNVLGTAVYAVLKYVDNNILEVTSIKKIASELGYSQSYISHAFKDKIGMTLQDYICHKKVELALELMKYKKVNVTQIAEMLNYNTVQAFSKMFKKVMGMSPTEYQNQYLG